MKQIKVMKAATRTSYGPPAVLTIKEVAIPPLKDHEILIKVHAATVNRTDCSVLWGKPFIIRFFTGLLKPSLPITGSDFAGKVENIGKNVSSFKKGDRVFGFNDTGLCSHAQYLVLSDKEAILKIPDKVGYPQAAASCEGAHYAYNVISKVGFEYVGKKVLVNGATGAIGSASLQLLKYYGAYVTAVCSTKHLALMKSLGADKVIDYTQKDFTLDDQRYDLVFDSVGKSFFRKCKPLLKPGGVYISSELGPYSQNPFLALLTPLISGKHGKKVKFPIPFNIRRSLTLIKTLLEKKKFKPLIHKEYPLEKIGDAYDFVVTGEKIGNIIITMQP